jgi:hypothetical protein
MMPTTIATTIDWDWSKGLSVVIPILCAYLHDTGISEALPNGGVHPPRG